MSTRCRRACRRRTGRRGCSPRTHRRRTRGRPRCGRPAAGGGAERRRRRWAAGASTPWLFFAPCPTAAERPCSYRGRARSPSRRASTRRGRPAPPLRSWPTRAGSPSSRSRPEMNGWIAPIIFTWPRVVHGSLPDRAVEDRVVLGLHVRRADDRVALVDVGDDLVDLVGAYPSFSRPSGTRLRLRDRRAGCALRRPREDDGRDPALHLGRDLEDREPARDRPCRRRRAGLPRRVEAQHEGSRDLPRQLEGRPAAVGKARRAQGMLAPAGGVAVAAPRRRRCRTTAPRSAASSASASTRATSTSASSRTAPPATSSSTSPRRARPSPA